MTTVIADAPEMLNELTDMPGLDGNGKFKFQNQKAMFTYKTHIDKEVIMNFFNNVRKSPCKFIRSAHENGTNDPLTPYEHTHVLVDFGGRYQTTNVRKFDIVVDDESIHPNIKKVTTKRHWENSLNYIAKEDPDNADLKAKSVSVQLNALSGCKDIGEALRENVGLKNGKVDYSQVLGIKTAFELLKERPTASYREPTNEWAIKLDEEIKNNKGNPRKVIWYTDYVGNSGKTEFQRYLQCCEETSNDWYCVTDMGSSKDASTIIMNAIDKGWSGKGLILDLPRTVEGHGSRIYQYLEDCLNGHVTATKYQGGNIFYDPQWIIVFANWMPVIDAMSLDRWDIRLIDENKCCSKISVNEARELKGDIIPKPQYEIVNLFERLTVEEKKELLAKLNSDV